MLSSCLKSMFEPSTDWKLSFKSVLSLPMLAVVGSSLDDSGGGGGAGGGDSSRSRTALLYL